MKPLSLEEKTILARGWAHFLRQVERIKLEREREPLLRLEGGS